MRQRTPRGPLLQLGLPSQLSALRCQCALRAAARDCAAASQGYLGSLPLQRAIVHAVGLGSVRIDVCQRLQHRLVVLQDPSHFRALVAERNAVLDSALYKQSVQPQPAVLRQDAERQYAHTLAPCDLDAPQNLEQAERKQASARKLER